MVALVPSSCGNKHTSKKKFGGGGGVELEQWWEAKLLCLLTPIIKGKKRELKLPYCCTMRNTMMVMAAPASFGNKHT